MVVWKMLLIRWRVSKNDGQCNLIESKQKKGIYQVLVNEDEYPENV
jgi:hypothetical protein